MGTLLHRFTVKPGHLDTWLTIWPDEVTLRRRHGFVVHQGFVETDAEPKVTWLYSHPDPEEAEAAVRTDPAFAELAQRKAGHVFGNTTLRPVEVEMMAEPVDLSRIAIVRRYSITGSWDEFLAIWRRIVPLRERHGFPCLFAVADRPKDMFTWAFGFDGNWEEFPAAQRPYYHDPERIALRGVFDYLVDYAVHPARQLPVR